MSVYTLQKSSRGIGRSTAITTYSEHDDDSLISPDHTEASPDASQPSAPSNFHAVVSDLAAEFRELKGYVVSVLLGDVAARSDGILTSNTAKDHACRHCRTSSQEPGGQSMLELADEWHRTS